MMNLAPIVLFVHKRLDHTQKTIESLKNCELADESDLYIFSDGPKSESEAKQVETVRNYLKNLVGFKSINITFRNKNLGLAENIISGVSEIIQKHGKVIVLEDDLKLGKYFLKFMNEALSKYETNKEVWHISGWNYPFNTTGFSHDTYFIRSMNCWGWGTWENRWKFFDRNLENIKNKFSSASIMRFNLNGAYNFYSQIEANLKGEKKTWAIFWYATIFFNNGLCLNPTYSLVQNLGLDGGGENCHDVRIYDHLDIDRRLVLEDILIAESDIAIERIKQFYLKSRHPFSSRLLKKFIKISSSFKW